MRALVQRVTSASVTVENEIVGEIEKGLCVFVGVTHTDSEPTSAKLATKLWNLRLFEDDQGVPNLSTADLNLPLLIVSQFTLYGDTSGGRRPSWINAARPEQAQPLIETLIQRLKELGANVETGRFQAEMKVSLVNDGPFTLTVEI